MSCDTILASAVQPKPVRWLWPGWLPEGVLVVLDGDPAVGKSTVTCDLAARLSRGELAGRPVTTILVNGEDDPEHTVRPRLGAAGADLDRVVLWNFQQPLALPDDVERLREAILAHGAGLVVIDPFTAVLGKRASAAGDQTVRRALMPLVRLAAETGCAILIVRHLRKQNGRALYRGLGSIGIVGAARVGWLLGPHPRGEGMRVLTATKMNLAAPPAPRVLQLGGGAVAWLGEEAWLSADEVAGLDAGTAAARWLDAVLDRGPKPAAEVKAEAAAAGFSERTLWRAKRLTAVVARRYYDVWYWCRPGDDPAFRFAGLRPIQAVNPACQSEVEAGPAEQKRWAKKVLQGGAISLTGPARNGTNGTNGPQASPGSPRSHSGEPPHGPDSGLHPPARRLPGPAELPEGGTGSHGSKPSPWALDPTPSGLRQGLAAFLA